MIEFAAIFFVIGCFMRVGLYCMDNDFGGSVWQTIMVVSSLTWVSGFIMALYILGLRIEVSL